MLHFAWYDLHLHPVAVAHPAARRARAGPGTQSEGGGGPGRLPAQRPSSRARGGRGGACTWRWLGAPAGAPVRGRKRGLSALERRGWGSMLDLNSVHGRLGSLVKFSDS